MQPITVLSLFDGMSCGRLALERAWIPVRSYYASEIDRYSMQVSENNRPDVIQVGDVREIRVKSDIKATGIVRNPDGDTNVYVGDNGLDLLIGGSPCQWFSNAGKGLNFEDPRSKLFFEFVRILNEAKPRYFLLENVKMKKEWQNIISEHLFGIQPVEIDSALVSAQRRKRLYRVWKRDEDWSYSQVIVSQPIDKGIFLRDSTLYGENKIWQYPRWFNEYQTQRESKFKFSGYDERSLSFLLVDSDEVLWEETIISKKFWFIERLIANDKLNKEWLFNIIRESCIFDDMNICPESDYIIMYLAIGYNPIYFLTSMVK